MVGIKKKTKLLLGLVKVIQYSDSQMLPLILIILLLHFLKWRKLYQDINRRESKCKLYLRKCEA